MKLDELRKILKLDIASLPANDPKEAHRQVRLLLQKEGFDLANLYQELEMSSPYVNTHRDTSYGFHSLSIHSHAYAELIYCRESPGVEYLVGTDRYRLQRGDILFIPPGTSHCPLLPERMDTPYIRDVLWISADFLQKIREFSRRDGFISIRDLAPFRTAGTKWEFLSELFARGVREEEAQQPGWELAVMGNTLQIFGHLRRIYAAQSSGKVQAEKPELLDRMAAYIEQNYTQHISAQDLAQQFFVSSSTVSHLFKQKMGVSVHRYLTQRRLIAAKSHIEAGESLENVALAVGFSDYSSFYRAFRQEYGISPRQYRSLQ